MGRESLHVSGRLLGQRRTSTIKPYVDLDDVKLSEAAEQLALVIQRIVLQLPRMAPKRREYDGVP